MHPLSIDDDTWQKMTPEQQANAYEKQSEIDAKEKADEKARIAAEKEQIATIKAHPKYGQYIQCVVSQGQYNNFMNDFSPVDKFSFDAIEGKTLDKTIVYYRNGNKIFEDKKSLAISFDGQQISICDASNSFDKPCSTLNATSSQYYKGVSLNIDNGILKGKIKCDMVFHEHNHFNNSSGNNIIINI